MKTTTISKGGQVSIPANVRHRWATNRVGLDDRGSALIIRPIPVDPIGAAIGSLAGHGPTTDELRSILRDEEASKDDRRRARR